jgi:hypothetical protein
MASQFANRIVAQAFATARNQATRDLIAVQIDTSMFRIRETLRHSMHRNHEHDPKLCSGCELAEEALKSLEIPVQQKDA